MYYGENAYSSDSLLYFPGSLTFTYSVIKDIQTDLVNSLLFFITYKIKPYFRHRNIFMQSFVVNPFQINFSDNTYKSVINLSHLHDQSSLFIHTVAISY